MEFGLTTIAWKRFAAILMIVSVVLLWMPWPNGPTPGRCFRTFLTPEAALSSLGLLVGSLGMLRHAYPATGLVSKRSRRTWAFLAVFAWILALAIVPPF